MNDRRTTIFLAGMFFLVSSVQGMQQSYGNAVWKDCAKGVALGVAVAGGAYVTYKVLDYLLTPPAKKTKGMYFRNIYSSGSVIITNGTYTLESDSINKSGNIIFTIPNGSHNVNAQDDTVIIDGKPLPVINASGIKIIRDFIIPIKHLAIHKMLACIKLGNYPNAYIEGDSAFIDAVIFKEVNGKLVASLKDPSRGLDAGNDSIFTIYAPLGGNEITVEHGDVELTDVSVQKITAYGNSKIYGSLKNSGSNLDIFVAHSNLTLEDSKNKYTCLNIVAVSNATVSVNASANITLLTVNHSTLNVEGDSENSSIKATSSANVTQKIKKDGKGKNLNIDIDHSDISLSGKLSPGGNVIIAGKSSSKIGLLDTGSRNKGGTIRISGDHSTITVDSAKEVDSAKIDAESNAVITIRNLKIQNLIVNSDHSTVTVSGQTMSQNVDLKSNASYNAGTLTSETCDLAMDHSRATVQVSKTLTGSAVSSSQVTVQGNPNKAGFTCDKRSKFFKA